MTDNDPKKSDLEEGLPLQAFEQVNNLNLEGHYPDVISFATQVWNLSTGYLNIFRDPTKKFNVEQRICLLFVSKAVRLLRSTWLLVENGYWPEAEIIQRAMLELAVEMEYILLDHSGKRAKKWSNHTDPKHRAWSFSIMVGEVSKAHGKAYEYYSQYPHNKLVSIQAYAGFTQEGLLYTREGPMSTENDMKKNADILGSIALQCGSILEMVQTRLPSTESWKEQHKSLYSQPYFISAHKIAESAFNDPRSKEEMISAVNRFNTIKGDPL